MGYTQGPQVACQMKQTPKQKHQAMGANVNREQGETQEAGSKAENPDEDDWLGFTTEGL